MQSIVLLSISLFAALGARAQNAVCPKPVVCAADPCDGAKCPRFLNTECRVDDCHGECRVTFFRLPDRKEVTDRCAGLTCAQKACPAGETCMNTVAPTTCPRNRPNCRQYIKPKCVQSPSQPQPPTDCSQVLCPPDRSFCEVRQTARGPRARCIPQLPPTSCEDVKCEKGMQCHERKGASPVVRCVPIRFAPAPSDCSELECSDGFVCVVMDGKAICVETPSPDECEQLACEEPNQECRIITFSNVNRAVCGPISDCSKLNCDENEGLECRVAGEGQMKVAFCTPTASCSDLMCNESGLECGVTEKGFAFCVPTTNCSCNEDEGLECRVVGEGASAVNACLRPKNCSVLQTTCWKRGLVCQEPQSQGDFAQASCVAAPSCKELQCNPGYTCIDFDNDREDGGDVGSGFLSPVLQSTGIPSDLVTAVCIANSTRANCADFPCEEDQVCSLQRYPSRSISLVTCPQGVYPQPPSCNNTELETCSGSQCVDLVQDGKQVSFSCVEVNCKQEDQMCTPGTTCIRAPLPAMNIDSACVQTAVQFELGTDCGRRASACTEGLACQEIQIEGNVVGTICNTPSSPVSCDNVECASTEECVQTEVGREPILATCVSSGILNNDLASILPHLRNATS